MPNDREIAMRGISIRPGAGGPGERLPRPDQPEEFRPIEISGLTEIQPVLTENGFIAKIVTDKKSRPVQLLIYRLNEVNEANNLSQLAKGSPLRQLPPEGVVWDSTSRRYVALPVVWTDALTARVFLEKTGNAVRLQTQDRQETGGRQETRILSKNEVYTEAVWNQGTQAAQFAQKGLGLPPGSPGGTTGVKMLSPIQWTPNVYGSFAPEGLYSAPPGTRYGFMGWVSPKKI